MTHIIQPASLPARPKIAFEKELNDEQLDVVLNGDGTCLVLAGAGTGKTRTLSYRVAYLVEQGADPSGILLMTFTNKAAFEMLNRVSELLGQKPKGIWGGTFHSVGNRILRLYADFAGFGSDFTILDQDDSKMLLKSILSDLSLPVKKEKYFPKPEIIQKILSYAQNSEKDVFWVCEKYYDHFQEDVVSALQTIANLYHERKKTGNVMDFDDLLIQWKLLLQNNDHVREKLSRQFRYILVDEYQDTNTIQAKIVDMLSAHHGNILAVGDDSQSIYSFRAANIKNILEFPKHYPDCRTFRLETNYRSRPEILELANETISKNASQFKKNLRSVKTSSSKPTLAVARDAYQQADFVCQRLLDLRDEVSHSLSEMCVLFRSAFQMIELELELNRRGIPYIVRGGIRFFEQAHIKDVVAVLKIVANIRDESSWMRALALREGVGLATAKKIFALATEQPDLSACRKAVESWSFSPRIKTSLHPFFSLLADLFERRAQKDFLSFAIRSVLSQYQHYAQSAFENASERIEDIEQLANFASGYASLDDFLSDVSLSEGFRGEVSRDEKKGDAEEALVLSTIHQAKGLEWATVFVIGLSDGQFPHRKVSTDRSGLEEERRLFYVACTRAKDRLFLSYPIFSRTYSSADAISRPSPFLTEIRQDRYEILELQDSDTRGFSRYDSEKVIEYRD